MARGDDSRGPDLRRRAESMLGHLTDVPEDADLSPEKMRLLVHELRVHQIELGMQNDELRRAQLALEQARDKYLDLYNYAPVAYFTLDKDGLISDANLTAVHLFGVEIKSLMKKPFFRLVCRDDRDIYYFHHQQVLETGNRQTCEIKLVKKSGEQFHAQLESIAAQEDDGDSSQLRIIVTDITERKQLEENLKESHEELETRVTERTAELSAANEQLRGEVDQRRQAEQALRESEQRFRAIFEGAEDYIFLKDRSLRYMDVNPAVGELFGVPTSEIIGRRREDLFGEAGSRHAREADLRVLEGETIEREQTGKVHGIPRTFLYTNSPLRDSSGEVIGILSISRDITERRRVEVSPQQTEGFPSKAMRSTLKSAISAAKTAANILLTGESGSGKDYLARYIHNHSDRASGPYFSVNCAAIPSGLAESELFGHERGAFTGAYARKRGLLELAEGGSLLLNEIGELSLPLQAKLLTFLDTKKITHVGGEKQITVNARLMAATNRDLEKEVKEGRFREDLFHRLNVISMELPPLRERKEDIPLLVRQMVAELCTQLQYPTVAAIAPETMNAMKRYGWPGNVRELRNLLERSLILSGGETIDLVNLELKGYERESLWDHSPPEPVPFSGTLQESLDHVIKARCLDALGRADGNKKLAARNLGIARDTMYRYLEKFGIGTED
jgi:PAS domain S-box-containing protein